MIKMCKIEQRIDTETGLTCSEVSLGDIVARPAHEAERELYEDLACLVSPPSATELNALIQSVLEHIAVGQAIPADQQALLDRLLAMRCNWV